MLDERWAGTDGLSRSCCAFGCNDFPAESGAHGRGGRVEFRPQRHAVRVGDHPAGQEVGGLATGVALGAPFVTDIGVDHEIDYSRWFFGKTQHSASPGWNAVEGGEWGSRHSRAHSVEVGRQPALHPGPQLSRVDSQNLMKHPRYRSAADAGGDFAQDDLAVGGYEKLSVDAD